MAEEERSDAEDKKDETEMQDADLTDAEQREIELEETELSDAEWQEYWEATSENVYDANNRPLTGIFIEPSQPESGKDKPSFSFSISFFLVHLYTMGLNEKIYCD